MSRRRPIAPRCGMPATRRAARPDPTARSSTHRRTGRRRRAAVRPAAGSRTAVRARAATVGWRAGCGCAIGSPTSSALMQSGSSRSSAQSPPPMTLPARAVATPSRDRAVGEEGAPVRRRHQFGAALGAAVGIMAAHAPRSRDRPRATRGSRSICRWSPRRRREPPAAARAASSTCTVPMTLVA